MKRVVRCFLVMVLLGVAPPLLAQEILDAARDGDLVRVQQLVADDPAQIHIFSDVHKNAVHFAAQNGHLDIVAYLDGQGADLDAPNIADETPLLYAVFFGHAVVVEYLVTHGAEVNKKTADGDTALDVAVMLDQESIVDLLREHGGVETVIGAPDIRQLAAGIQAVTFPYGETPNICLSTGSDGLLLVDTGYPRVLKPLRELVQQITNDDIAVIINTHLHHDHAGANDAGGAQTLYIDHDRLEQLVVDGAIQRGDTPLFGKTGKFFPTYYFFEFNGEEIRFIPVPEAHTHQDIIVHFTGSNVVHMGDLLISQSFPSVREAVPEYLEILATTIDLFSEDTILVCGHGRECRIENVRSYRQMLTDIVKLVIVQLDQGVAIEEIKTSPELDQYEAFNQFIPILSVDYWIEAILRHHGLTEDEAG